MELIDKAAVTAEIQKRFDKYSSSILKHYDAWKEAKAQELGKILVILNTLEVKEVDFDKAVANWWSEYYGNVKKNYTFEGYSGHYMENSTIIRLATHFFELGLKAQKGE